MAIYLTPESISSAHVVTWLQCPTRAEIREFYDNAIFLRIVKNLPIIKDWHLQINLSNSVIKTHTLCQSDEFTTRWFVPGENQNVLHSKLNVYLSKYYKYKMSRYHQGQLGVEYMYTIKVSRRILPGVTLQISKWPYDIWCLISTDKAHLFLSLIAYSCSKELNLWFYKNRKATHYWKYVCQNIIGVTFKQKLYFEFVFI